MKALALTALLLTNLTFAGELKCVGNLKNLKITIAQDQKTLTAVLKGPFDRTAQPPVLGNFTGTLVTPATEGFELYNKQTYDILDTENVKGQLEIVKSTLIGRGGRGGQSEIVRIFARLTHKELKERYECY